MTTLTISQINASHFTCVLSLGSNKKTREVLKFELINDTIKTISKTIERPPNIEKMDLEFLNSHDYKRIYLSKINCKKLGMDIMERRYDSNFDNMMNLKAFCDTYNADIYNYIIDYFNLKQYGY